MPDQPNNPNTLPADFFSSPNSAAQDNPDTLPADFFSQQKESLDKNEVAPPSTMGGVQNESFTEHPVMSSLEHLSNMGTNFLRSGEETAQGVAKLINKIPVVGEKIVPKEGLEAWQQTSESRPQAGNALDRVVGYGGETLLEFLLGEEALKGLSLADKMLNMQKVVAVLEKHTSVMKALQMGANISKAASYLSPEEAALLKQHPRIAKLVGLGMDSLRAGIVQGAQVTTKTGGDVEQAGKEAALMAGTNFALGAPFAVAGATLSKGKEASKTVKEMGNIAEKAPTSSAVNTKLSETVEGAVSGERKAAESKLHESTKELTEFAHGAPSNPSITESAQEMAKEANKKMHSKYEEGVKDLSQWLDGETIPYEGSPLHKAAEELAEKGSLETKPLDKAFSKTRPGSPRANRMVDSLANVGKESEEGTEQVEKWVDVNGIEHVEPVVVEKAPPIDLTVNELIERRQQLGERLRNLGWSTAEERADRQIYHRLIDAIDDTIKQMGDQVGNPEVSKRLGQINKEYRESVRLFNNRDVQSLLKGNINDVTTRLMRGETSLEDIEAVRNVVGDQNFNKLGVESLQRMVADAMDSEGKLDYIALLKRWQKIKPEVRKSMFGSFNADTFSHILNEASGASKQLENINDTVAKVLGNGDISSLIKSPEKLKELEQVIKPEGMKSIGKSLLESKIAEASTKLDKNGKVVKTHFDANKVLEWWESLKDSEEARKLLFHPDRATELEYERIISELKNVESVKKVVKYGILPATLGGLVGQYGSMSYALATIIGSLAGQGMSKGVKEIFEAIANNPKMWKTIGAVSTAGEKASNVATGVAGRSAVKMAIDNKEEDNRRQAKRNVFAGAEGLKGRD